MIGARTGGACVRRSIVVGGAVEGQVEEKVQADFKAGELFD